MNELFLLVISLCILNIMISTFLAFRLNYFGNNIKDVYTNVKNLKNDLITTQNQNMYLNLLDKKTVTIKKIVKEIKILLPI